jgi:hypothetical protein
VAKEWSLGIQYRFTQSDLRTVYPAVPLSMNTAADAKWRANLHTTSLFGLFNHPSGFFARLEHFK